MSEWNSKALVSTDWLAENLGDANLRIYDATVHLRPSKEGPYMIESGLADYEAGHIPGAGFLDLIKDLSDTSSKLAFTMPSAERLAKGFGAAGISNSNRVVLYSSTTPMWATRAWWMLRSMGFTNVAVLDGGVGKWKAEGRAIATGREAYAPATLSLTADASAWADKQAVLDAIGDEGVCTINALSPDVFSGEGAMSYGRKGHITGSKNVPYASLVNKDGTFKSADELRPLFEASGALKRPRIICYCGGGISATMDAMALVQLGAKNIAVYDGSMSEWCRDPELPMETGS